MKPVTMVMLVGGAEANQPVVGPRAAQQLASLGITRVALLQDASAVGVILEGWAFDPACIDDVVRVVFPDSRAAIRVFREVQHVAVSSVAAERST
jgi:hypothetical protein